MTVHTYRFQKQEPIDQTSLRNEAGATTTLAAADGGDIQDITQDDATDALADLDDAMAIRGYVRIATDPDDAPSDSFTPQSGGGGGGTSGEWRFDTTTTAANPGANNFRFNNAAYASITAVYVNDTAQNPTFDFGLIFATLNIGDILIIQQNNDATRAVELLITSIADNTGWWTFGVAHVQNAGGAMIQNNRSSTIAMGFQSSHLRHNLAATTDPTTGDDSNDGYAVGSVWINVTSDEAFIAVDVTVAAAVWKTLTSEGRFAPVVFPARKLVSPLVADWAINALAPLSEDPTNASLHIIRLDDTTEQGGGLEFYVPAGAVSMLLTVMSRPISGPAGAVVGKLRVYESAMPDTNPAGAGPTAWSAAIALDDVNYPITTTLYHYDTTTKTLASWGLTADLVHRLELTRTATGDTVVGDIGIAYVVVRFT